MITANWTEWVAGEAWRHIDGSMIEAAPRAFREVYWLAGDHEIDPRRLMAIVASDPVFAIKVLRIANMAAFAAAGEVTSIELAVVRLGTRAVRNAVLAACLSAWGQTVDAYGRRGADEMQHSVGTAYLARRLAERMRLTADEAFVLGLLHDVGKLFLMKLRAEFLRLGGRSPSAEEFEAVCESRHGEFGAVALQLWGLPESVRVPVQWHHDPAAAPSHQQEAALTWLANRLSHRYGFGRTPDCDAVDMHDPICSSLPLPAGWLEALDREALTLGTAAKHLVS